MSLDITFHISDLLGVVLMVMEFACHTSVCAKIYFHGAIFQSLKSSVVKYGRAVRVMSYAFVNSKYLLDLSLRHTDSDLVKLVHGNGMTANEEKQKTDEQ